MKIEEIIRIGSKVELTTGERCTVARTATQHFFDGRDPEPGFHIEGDHINAKWRGLVEIARIEKF